MLGEKASCFGACLGSGGRMNRPSARRRLGGLLLLIIVALTMVVVWNGDCDIYNANIVPTKVDVVVRPFSVSSPDAKHDVILSAYMNSGSRFTGRLLGFLPNSFYFYEPMWKFSVWDYFRPPDLQCSTTSASCRKIRTKHLNTLNIQTATEHFTELIMKNVSDSFQPAELLVNTLSRVFACDLVALQKVVQDRVQDHPSYAGPSWERYRWCIQAFKPKSQCLKELETNCRERRNRVTKVLRLTVGAFRPLLEVNPLLKIVHLVRDPRAIIHSRRYSRFFPVGRQEEDTAAMAKSLCGKMQQDVLDALELMEEYPNRVTVVYYEDLFENLHTRLKQLYGVLNIRYNKLVVNTLSEVKANLSPPQLGIDFQNDRERNNTKWWRQYMAWSDIEVIDSECKMVNDRLGYTTYTNEKELRDLSIPGYNIPHRLRLPGQPG